eukprot:4437652-Amphidinium_carterae.1
MRGRRSDGTLNVCTMPARRRHKLRRACRSRRARRSASSQSSAGSPVHKVDHRALSLRPAK